MQPDERRKGHRGAAGEPRRDAVGRSGQPLYPVHEIGAGPTPSPARPYEFPGALAQSPFFTAAKHRSDLGPAARLYRRHVVGRITRQFEAGQGEQGNPEVNGAVAAVDQAAGGDHTAAMIGNAIDTFPR